MTTKDYKRLHELHVEHQRAIDALLEGCTDAEAADHAGVHRVTVTQWRLYHLLFRAELNRRRAEELGTAAETLRGLLPEALETLADQLRIGDRRDRLALDVLHRAGVFTAVATSALAPTDPDEILDQEVRRRRSVTASSSKAAGENAPITEEERQATCEQLLAGAYASDGPSEEAGDVSAPPDSPRADRLPARTVTSTSMHSLS